MKIKQNFIPNPLRIKESIKHCGGVLEDVTGLELIMINVG